MTHIQNLTSGLIVLSVLVPALAQTKSTRVNREEQTMSRVETRSAHIDRGQEVFLQNCRRCHDAPQAFPPQISATIIRHMRVRASLSDADESALLSFMNP